MRSSTLPLMDKASHRYKTKKELYHISFASECQRCFETCVKPRRLPCEHEFCKSCLKEYFKEIEDDIAKNTFPCPACDKPLQKPLMPKWKWTKAYKLDKASSFFADRPVSTSSVSRASNHIPNRFGCKINTEHYPCAFWGGDVSLGGEIFLPDWYNHTVKVFSENGKLLAFDKFLDPPLDVTVLPDNSAILSYGRVTKKVTLVRFEFDKLIVVRNVGIDGHLYNTTRLGKKCLGVLELKDNTVTLATVSTKGSVRLLDIGIASELIASSSGICYDKITKRIYLTQKHNFVCLDSGAKLIFEKSYPLREKDHYLLGSVTADQQSNIYIATENGILHVDFGGNLRRFIPTPIEPFHIMVSHDSLKLYVVGRNERVEICPTGYSSATEA